MREQEVIKTIQSELKFTDASIRKLKIFAKSVIDANREHNLISKSTEVDIWHRHILDSAQLVKFISFKNGSLADLGSGAGFPGIVLAIFNNNKDFHVKLYEKSPVKLAFLKTVIEKLELNALLYQNIYESTLESDYIVCRAFKKLKRVIQVSREIAKKPHKLIVLKGENAQEEVNNAFKNNKYPYKLEKSMTNDNSKILIANF
jgi:16S rRNA (guanine527-N7)-methyltransferase|tara:strand:+ start:643 stop:1251 length:609 start_codon:yes stop_codon:yes gene_type:complete